MVTGVVNPINFKVSNSLVWQCSIMDYLTKVWVTLLQHFGNGIKQLKPRHYHPYLTHFPHKSKQQINTCFFGIAYLKNIFDKSCPKLFVVVVIEHVENKYHTGVHVNHISLFILIHMQSIYISGDWVYTKPR